MISELPQIFLYPQVKPNIQRVKVVFPIFSSDYFLALVWVSMTVLSVVQAFQMMMLAYNLFLLFKFDSLSISEYRQQIKTFRLKYMFLAAKFIRTARYVVMKLSAKYPYKDVYEKCLS